MVEREEALSLALAVGIRMIVGPAWISQRIAFCLMGFQGCSGGHPG